MGDVDAAVSSPPFAQSIGSDDPDKRGGLFRDERRRNDVNLTGEYGDTPGQLGRMDSEPTFENFVLEMLRERFKERQRQQENTFWNAARQVVSQVYDCLVPGAHAIWVVKAYIRDKQVVDFPGQWQAMCEACGFVTEHIHKAWMVEERGVQLGFFEDKDLNVKRSSFFRRLYESKYPENAIDYEIVLCMSKPEQRSW